MLFLEGKITIFKSLAFTQIVHLATITEAPNTVIEELKQIQKTIFVGKQKSKN